jgi:hypothetical protein
VEEDTMTTVLSPPSATVTPTPTVAPTPVRQRRTGRIVALVIGLIIAIAALAVGAWALFFRGETTTALTEVEQIALAKQHAAVYYPVAAFDGSDLLPSGHIQSVTARFEAIPAAPLPVLDNSDLPTKPLPTVTEIQVLPANDGSDLLPPGHMQWHNDQLIAIEAAPLPVNDGSDLLPPGRRM